MRLLKIMAGAALLPAALGAVWAAGSALLPQLTQWQATWPLLAGALLFSTLHALPLFTGKSFSGNRFYVAAHELTHALAAVFSGVKVRKISVGRRNGYVLLDSTNAFISLAPYFVPFYTLAAAAAYGAARHFFPGAPLRPWFLAAAGFTLAFHLLHTADILSGPVQSDLRKAGGAFFSLTLLLLLNCAGLALALRLLYPELFSFRAYLLAAAAAQAEIYRALGGAAAYLFNTAKIYLPT
jgi:hypothetical protein